MPKDCTGRSASRTSATEAAYAKRFLALAKLATLEYGESRIENVVVWFTRQHKRWKESTVRQYRAVIRRHVEILVGKGTTHEQLIAQLYAGPAPACDGPKRTSAKKRRTLEQTEHQALLRHLAAGKHADDMLISGFVYFGPKIFLRPSEYRGAWMDGELLHVPNAKATNGRANGLVREGRPDLSDQERNALNGFLERLNAAAFKAESWNKLIDRLSARLARICKSIGIRRVSFYTLRHVGMAIAKNNLSAREVAAAAGHASVRTATSHYARKQTGWKGVKATFRPLPRSVALVQGDFKNFQPGLRAPDPGWRL